MSKYNKINIVNRKARFDYEIVEKFVAGIRLTGSEIKSVREGKVNIKESFCHFHRGELWIKGMHISEYNQAAHYGHAPVRERKLMMNKKELLKIEKAVKEKGLSIVPLRMFITERGWAKIEISLARGKRSYDKRQSIKAKDVKREMDRNI